MFAAYCQVHTEGLSRAKTKASCLWFLVTLTPTEAFTTHGVCTHHCAGFQHFLHLVHHGKAVGGHTGVGWGTGRAGPWARGLPQGGAEDGGCPDLRRPHWSHRGHGEIGGSCLHGGRSGEKNWFRLPKNCPALLHNNKKGAQKDTLTFLGVTSFEDLKSRVSTYYHRGLQKYNNTVRRRWSCWRCGGCSRPSVGCWHISELPCDRRTLPHDGRASQPRQNLRRTRDAHLEYRICRDGFGSSTTDTVST